MVHSGAEFFVGSAAQVVTYQGRAAVPLAPLLGGFRKSFFLQPRTLDLFGRVQVRSGVSSGCMRSLAAVLGLWHLIFAGMNSYYRSGR